MKEALLSLSRYHRWAFGRLYKGLTGIHGPDYRADYGLFFRSIHGTLNHLLLVDRVWFGRLTDKPYHVTGLDQELEQDRERLEYAIYEGCDRWTAWIADQPEDTLSGTCAFASMDGTACRNRVDHILLHVFNHGTHHRGQVTAIMTHLGLETPVLDYIYFLRERE